MAIRERTRSTDSEPRRSARGSRWALGLSAVALALSGPVSAQNRSEDVVIRTKPVAGNVYMLEGQGGNIGVSVGEDGILLIDDQFAPLAEKIRAAVSDLRKGKIEFVLNTHWHPDHTGGNPIFGKEGKIIAHANVRRRLSGEKPTPGRPPSKMEPSGLPAITFHDGITLHFNGEEVRILHFPHGHTDGDSIIFFDTSKVVHMGDHFFNDRFPFVDLTSGGTLGGYMTNVATVIELLPDDWKVIPGHGALGEKKDLQRFRDMLESTVAFVRKQMDAGKTLEEIRDEGLPEKWESWGEGFISEARWIETIHESLSNAPETAPDAEKDKGAEKEKPAASEK